MTTTTYSRTGHPVAIPAEELRGLPDLLELVASKRPDLLGSLIESLATSPEKDAVHELARSWGLAEPDQLWETVFQALTTLKRLEGLRGQWSAQRYRGHWIYEGQWSAGIVTVPNVRAVCSLAAGRAGRALPLRRERLGRIIRNLTEARELEQVRQQIDDFLAEPPADGARDLVGRWFGKRPGGDP